MPPTDDGLQPPTPEELEAERAQLAGDDPEPVATPPEPVIQMREPNQDEIRGAATRYIQENPDEFRTLIPEPAEPLEPSYDPTEIHETAVRTAEQRMLVRQQLIESAVGDVQKHFAAKGLPDHVFSEVRSALGDPNLSLEQLAAHIKNGNHRGVVTNAIGRLALAGEWTAPTTNAGGEGVGGGGSGMSGAQREELEKAEGLLGRKLTPQEQREWVVSN